MRLLTESKVQPELEKYYRVKELAYDLGVSRDTVIRRFGNEMGVIHLKGPKGNVTRLIPKSVVERVLNRMTR